MSKQLVFRDADKAGVPLGRQATKVDLIDIANAIAPEGTPLFDDRATVQVVRADVRGRLQGLVDYVALLESTRVRLTAERNEALRRLERLQAQQPKVDPAGTVQLTITNTAPRAPVPAGALLLPNPAHIGTTPGGLIGKLETQYRKRVAATQVTLGRLNRAYTRGRARLVARSEQVAQ